MLLSAAWAEARGEYRTRVRRRIAGASAEESGRAWAAEMDAALASRASCAGRAFADAARWIAEARWAAHEAGSACHAGLFWDTWRVARTGWTRAVPAFRSGPLAGAVENVAEHSLKTRLVAQALWGGDDAALARMALTHDVAEVVVGDLTPGQYASRAEKHAREAEAFVAIVAESGIDASDAARILDEFAECMQGTSPRAVCVRIADKVDMALQAMAYEAEFGIDLTEFLTSAAADIVQAAHKL